MTQDYFLQLESSQRQHNEKLRHEYEMSTIAMENNMKLFSMLKPKLTIDGDQWCCLYGEDLRVGIAGFGDSTYKAIQNWNQEWYKKIQKTRMMEKLKDLKFRARCKCVGVEMGSYRAAIPMWYDAEKRVVLIDHCLAIEINELWKRNIRTIESCCGHGKEAGYIAVDESSTPRMKIYDYIEDALHPNCFIPKYTTPETVNIDFNDKSNITKS